MSGGAYCTDDSHRTAYQCARCSAVHCRTCDQPSRSEDIKTEVRWCPNWRCQRERAIETGRSILLGDGPPVDLDNLARLALAATPGPWTATSCNQADASEACGVRAADVPSSKYPHVIGKDGASDECHHMWRRADASFVAACDPATILALVAEIRMWHSRYP